MLNVHEKIFMTASLFANLLRHYNPREIYHLDPLLLSCCMLYSQTSLQSHWIQHHSLLNNTHVGNCFTGLCTKCILVTTTWLKQHKTCSGTNGDVTVLTVYKVLFYGQEVDIGKINVSPQGCIFQY